MGGVDALIFTGGVGENHAGIRAAVVAKLAFLGVEIDSHLNKLPTPPDRDLATDSRSVSPAARLRQRVHEVSRREASACAQRLRQRSQVRLLAIHTQEEWEIARTCWQHLSGEKGSS